MSKIEDSDNNILKNASNPKVNFKKPTKLLKEPAKNEFTKKLDVQAIELLDKALALDTKSKTALFKKGPTDGEALYKAFKNFEIAIGGREILLKALSHCPHNSLGYAAVMKLIADPDFVTTTISKTTNEEHQQFTLAAVCSKHKLPLNVVVAAFRDSKVAENAMEALLSTSKHTGPIVEQVVEDSKNGWIACQACMGRGRMKKINEQGEFALDEHGEVATTLCFTCRGEGITYKAHDFANRKAFLEMTGILKKEPLVSNTIDNRSVNVGTPDDGSYEGLMKSMDNLARSRQHKQAVIIEEPIIDVQPEDHSS